MIKVRSYNPLVYAGVILKKIKFPLIGLALASSITFLAYTYLKRASGGLETVSLLVTARDLSLSQTVNEGDLAAAKFAKGYVPQNAILDDDIKQMIGKKVRFNLKKGDLIALSMFETLDKSSRAEYLQGKKVFYVRQEDFHIIPPSISTEVLVDIIAAGPPAAALLSEVTVVDINRSGGGVKEVALIGLALTDSQIYTLSAKLASEAKLMMVLRPR